MKTSCDVVIFILLFVTLFVAYAAMPYQPSLGSEQTFAEIQK